MSGRAGGAAEAEGAGAGAGAEGGAAGVLARCARELADGIEAAIPGWTERSVARIMVAWSGSLPRPVADAASESGRRAAAEVGGSVRALLMQDVDEQRATPLSLIRAAVRYPTEVLRTAGVPPVARDEFAERSFPDDIYGLSPSSLADVAPDLHELGIAWGAAKAFEYRRRHGGGGAGDGQSDGGGSDGRGSGSGGSGSGGSGSGRPEA